MTERLLAVSRDAQPDEDGLCEIRHDLGVLDVSVSLYGSVDPDALIGIINPIDENVVEVVVTTTEQCRFMVTVPDPDAVDDGPPPEAPAEPVESAAERTRRLRWGG
jgi:hypothetical protein